MYTDEKENKFLLIYEEIQTGSGAKLCVTNGHIKYGLIFAHFLLH
jgi:hypothetical protein